MIDYKEKFEKTKIAGAIAAGTLDEICSLKIALQKVIL
mgnify:CR=1 FL=1